MADKPAMARPEAYRGSQPFAFVSYAHGDASRIFPEVAALSDEGYRIYFDAGITPGHTWHDELADGIERCSVFLLFLTPRAVASANCQRELHFALDLNKPIIAVHLEPTELPSGVRLAIGDKQAILAYELSSQSYQRSIRAALSEYLSTDDAEPAAEPATPAAPPHGRRSPWRYALAAVAAVGIGVAYLAVDRWQQAGQRQDALERLAAARALMREDRYGEAFVVARELAPWLQHEPGFVELWEDITLTIEPRVSETGAAVRMRPYESADAPWIDLGVTPLSATAAPRGVLLLEIEKPGFVTRRYAVANPGPMVGNARFELAPMPEIELTPAGAVPEDMVRIPPTDFPIYVQGFTRELLGDARFEMPAFAVGRGEVSNRAFKAFVDAGGYADADLWRGMKLPDGTPLDREVIDTFVDTTGRPGPAGWALGTYPTGRAELPVGGLSWYEALAYARFRGLALPSLHHWARAAYAPDEAISETAPAVSRASNFDSDGPVAVSRDTGIGPWGTVNTAGNVREWVWNRAEGQGLAMGGAWIDYPGIYQDAYTLDRLDRSPQNGLRLMHTLGEPIETALLEPLTLNRDTELSRRAPVSDEAFAAMRFQFTHARRIPQSVSRETVEGNDTWTAEEVKLAFSSEETLTLYMVKPATAQNERLQPVIYMPNGSAANRTPNRFLLTHVGYLDFVVRGGRALVMPIWANTAQRHQPPAQDRAALADRMRRLALAWHEDAANVLDYLETRDDIDADRVGFLGNSYGAIFGPIPLALERRFATAVLIAGGIPNVLPLHPMLDPINYVPRVEVPVLMVNGRYDHLFLYENSQKRMFDLLGTPAGDKRHLLFDTGHFAFPRNQVAREVTDWFDRYLGPVNAAATASL